MVYDWLHFFHKSTKDRISRGGYHLLLMDGHGSHKTYKFLEFCQKYCIIPFCFPAHIMHLLQPLDGQPPQVYKEHYCQYNNATVQWGGSIKGKRDFLRGIDSVRQLNFQSSNYSISLCKKRHLSS
jgi:hypothetical protein